MDFEKPSEVSLSVFKYVVLEGSVLWYVDDRSGASQWNSVMFLEAVETEGYILIVSDESCSGLIYAEVLFLVSVGV